MAQRPSANDAFDKFSDKLFRSYLELHPIEATRLGIHGPNDARLPDRSPEGCEGELASLQDLQRELGEFREKDLTIERAVDLRLARGGLTGRILRLHRNPSWKCAPSLYVNEVVSGVYSLILRDFAPARERVRALMGRLNETPAYLDHARANLQNPPDIFTETAAMKARGAVHFFNTGLKDFIESVDAPRLRSQLEKAAAGARTAMDAYREWLESDLMARSHGDFAIGRHLYDRLLAEEYALPWTSDDLIAMGQQVYQETMREVKRVAARIDAGKPWSKVVEDLKTVHPQAGDLLASYKAQMERAREFVKRTCLAGMFPEGEAIEIVATPAFARPIIPYAAYLPPAPFEKEQKGTFWVTTIDPSLPEARRETLLRGQTQYVIGVQALHDAYPGHHLQLVRANQLKERKLRFLFSSSLFSEGWALYCEGMMHRNGFYNDDRVRLLQLKNLIWRACRVIIDVELQTGRMGFNEAVTFLARKAHIERPNAVSEVRRYCADPTQPMCSVAGKILIEELFEDTKALRGDAFDSHVFHDQLLGHGTIPIELVRMEMGLPHRVPNGVRAGRRTLPAGIS